MLSLVLLAGVFFVGLEFLEIQLVPFLLVQRTRHLSEQSAQFPSILREAIGRSTATRITVTFYPRAAIGLGKASSNY